MGDLRWVGLWALLALAAACDGVIGDASVDVRGSVDESGSPDVPGSGTGRGEMPGAPDEGSAVETFVLDVQDAYVNSALPGLNFDVPILEIDGAPNIKYSLIKPRSIDQVPAGARVVRATLELVAFNGGSSFGVHELTSPWRADRVTFEQVPGRTDAFATAPGTVGAHSIDVGDLVQGWVDGRIAYGVALFPQGIDGVDLYSSDAPDADLHPRFVVDVLVATGNDGDGGDETDS